MAAPPTSRPTSARRRRSGRLDIRPLTSADAGWLQVHLDEAWGGPLQVRRSERIDARRLDGLVAERDGTPAGVLLHAIRGREAELALLSTWPAGAGTGSALLDAFRPLVAGCSRVWLVTTNDNLPALRFYQRRGWRLFVLRSGAVDEARRRLKPAIPAVGVDGVPVCDELELEWVER